jgi:hypothetical protein
MVRPKMEGKQGGGSAFFAESEWVEEVMGYRLRCADHSVVSGFSGLPLANSEGLSPSLFVSRQVVSGFPLELASAWEPGISPSGTFGGPIS